MDLWKLELWCSLSTDSRDRVGQSGWKDLTNQNHLSIYASASMNIGYYNRPVSFDFFLVSKYNKTKAILMCENEFILIMQIWIKS